MASKSRVMVFGVFDLLHQGHLYLLYHARLQGKALTAVIARDEAVKRLKGKPPAWNERMRIRAVKATGLAAKVVLGDPKEGDYAVIKRYRPDLICLGYDQSRLKQDLLFRMKSNRLPKVPLYTLKAYRPAVFHTSIKRQQQN